MTWLTPLIGGIAAAVAIPTLLILYFLKLRRRDLDVSTTLLWKKAIEDLRANAPFQKLRRNILLLLQMLALLAGLFAVAQPQFTKSQSLSGKRIIIIDRSRSMATLDETDADGRPITRLDRAKQQAVELIDSLPEPGLFQSVEPSEVMVIAFDQSAEVLQSFTSDRARLRRAIESIQPTDSSTQFDEAMKLAGAYVSRFLENVGLVPVAPIELWSDGAIQSLDQLDLPPETNIRFHSIGKADTANVAITAMRASRRFDQQSGASVFIGVQSTFAEPRRIDVQLSVNGVVASVRSIDLPPAADPDRPSTAGVVFDVDEREPAVLAAEITTADSLTADNSARLVLPPSRRLSVAIVSEGNLFLRHALSAMPLNRLDVISRADFEKLTSEARSATYDVYILDGWVPKPAPLASDAVAESAPSIEPALPPGRYITFGAVPAVSGLTVLPARAEKQSTVITDWTRDHPALRLSNLDSIVISEAQRMRATGAARTLAQDLYGPVITEVAEGAVHAIVVGFGAADSNWPFDPGFVLFLASAVEYLGQQAGLDELSAAPGETLTTRLPTGVERATIIQPTGEIDTLIAGSDGSVSYGPLRSAGLYQIRWRGPAAAADRIISGETVRAFGVNLHSTHESRINAREKLDLPSGAVTALAEQSTTARPIWRWLLLAALAVILLEWYIYNRKVHV